MKCRTIIAILFVLSFLQQLSGQQANIVDINPTPFFPKKEIGKALQQIVRVKVKNAGTPASLNVKLQLKGIEPLSIDLGLVESGSHVFDVLVPDIKSDTDITFKLLDKRGRLLDEKRMAWRPQKKWKVYYAAISHHDLGFITYYQNIRRGVREEGINLALAYCEQTDAWEEDDQFRWNIETSEPLIG